MAVPLIWTKIVLQIKKRSMQVAVKILNSFPCWLSRLFMSQFRICWREKKLILPKLTSCCQSGWNCSVNACAWTARETFWKSLCQELLLVFLRGSPKSCWFILVCLKMQMTSDSYTVARNIENSYPHTISLTLMPGWTLYHKSS